MIFWDKSQELRHVLPVPRQILRTSKHVLRLCKLCAGVHLHNSQRVLGGSSEKVYNFAHFSLNFSSLMPSCASKNVSNQELARPFVWSQRGLNQISSFRVVNRSAMGSKLHTLNEEGSPPRESLAPAILQKCVGGFLLYKFWRIFAGIFLEDFFGHFFPTKMRRKKSGEKIREKIRRPKNKNPRKIRHC